VPYSFKIALGLDRPEIAGSHPNDLVALPICYTRSVWPFAGVAGQSAATNALDFAFRYPTRTS
jgi:hypothetical protein